MAEEHPKGHYGRDAVYITKCAICSVRERR